MAFCHKCGKEVTDEYTFCPHCGARTVEAGNTKNAVRAESSLQPAVQAPPVPEKQQTAPKQKKVDVEGGKYIGKKWFIKFAYKTYVTDVYFFDERVVFSQGSGTSVIGQKMATVINYSSIYDTEVEKRYSIPNLIFSLVIAVIGVLTAAWSIFTFLGAFAIAAVVFFLGKTAVVSVRYSGGEYVVPTEFLLQAEELRDKIYTAKKQSLG